MFSLHWDDFIHTPIIYLHFHRPHAHVAVHRHRHAAVHIHVVNMAQNVQLIGRIRVTSIKVPMYEQYMHVNVT